MRTFHYYGRRAFIESLIMSDLPVGWAIDWVLDGPGPSLGL